MDQIQARVPVSWQYTWRKHRSLSDLAGTWSAELSLVPWWCSSHKAGPVCVSSPQLPESHLNKWLCGTEGWWWCLSLLCYVGTVMGGCVGRSRMDAQGSARSSTRSKKRGGKRLFLPVSMGLYWETISSAECRYPEGWAKWDCSHAFFSLHL